MSKNEALTLPNSYINVKNIKVIDNDENKKFAIKDADNNDVLTVDNNNTVVISEDVELAGGSREIRSSGGNFVVDAGGSNSLILQTNNTNALTIDASQNITVGNLQVSGVLSGLSGTYTPTVTAGTNVTTTSIVSAYYLRIGNIVNTYVRLSATSTLDNTTSIVYVSLPINLSNNFTSDQQLVGTGTVLNTNDNVAIIATTGTTNAQVQWIGLSTEPNLQISFMYEVF